MKKGNNKQSYYSVLLVSLSVIILFIIVISCVNYTHQFQYNKILNNMNFLLQMMAYVIAIFGILKYVNVLILKLKYKRKNQELKYRKEQDRLSKEKTDESDKIIYKFFKTARPDIRHINKIYQKSKSSYLMELSKKYGIQYEDIDDFTKNNIERIAKIKTISTDAFLKRMSSMQSFFGNICKEFSDNTINKDEVINSIGVPFLNFMNRYSKTINELRLKKYYINFYNLYNILNK